MNTEALLPGTLEMLILRTLTLGEMHGYGIAQHLRQVSRACRIVSTIRAPLISSQSSN